MEKVKLLRIVYNDNKKVFNIFRNVDKHISLSLLRELDSKKKISSDYKFLDGGAPIEKDLEDVYVIEDFCKDDKSCIIFVEKKSLN